MPRDVFHYAVAFTVVPLATYLAFRPSERDYAKLETTLAATPEAQRAATRRRDLVKLVTETPPEVVDDLLSRGISSSAIDRKR